MSHTGAMKKCPRTVTRPRSRTTAVVRKADISGHKYSPAPNPPDTTYQPWYNVTLVYPFTNQATITVNSLAGRLREQLDPTKRGLNQRDSGDGRFIVQLRLESVACWNLTSGSRMIALSVEDYHDTISSKGGRDQLCGIIDTGGSGIAPKAGYKLPISHRQAVLRNDDLEGEIVLITIAVGSNESGIAHIKVLFRFDGPSKLPTFFPNHLSEIATSTKRIAKKLPDTISIPLVGKSAYVTPTILPVTQANITSNESDSDEENVACYSDHDSIKSADTHHELKVHEECPKSDPSTTDILVRLKHLEHLVSDLGITAPKPQEEGSQSSDFSLMEETN